MHKLIVAALLYTVSVAVQAACPAPILDKTERRLVGGEENLCAAHGGQVVLVVNTASKCGYTPQYEGLEALYRANKDKGLTVLGFPSDQFMNQEFADDAEIAKFCKLNYGVSFPMYRKTEVKGANAHPLYKDLIAATGKSPSWNFNKYLIGRDGTVLAHFGSDVRPDSPALKQAIEAALKQPAR